MKSGCWMTPATLIAGLALLVSACGEGGKESAHRGLSADEAAARTLGTDGDGVGYVGTDLCLGCHRDEVAECLRCHPTYKLDPEGAAAYLASRHVNHSPLIDASPETASCRAACHDPVGDGPLLEGRPEVTGSIPARGLAAVGCEACHGGGARHFGSGPMPVRKPDFQVCGRCHNEGLSALHAGAHPEGLAVLKAYAGSAHGKSLNDFVFSQTSPGRVTALCSRCHTDQGIKLYGDVEGGHDALEAAIPVTVPPLAGASPVQCRTCHDAHNPSALLRPATADASAEFRTCTACHQAPAAFGTADSIHGENSEFSWVDDRGVPTRVVGVGRFSPGRILYDTHFDDPTTDGIEGYNLKVKDHRTCRACHDVHAANPAINRQWAASGHGGGLAAVKAAQTQPAAILAAAVTVQTSAAWTTFDFKDKTSGFDGKGRQACQRCHTTTGFVNYTADPVHYDPAGNDFSHLAGKQREMLYCHGCHADNAGGLRAPGAMVARYTAETVEYPAVGSSDLCLACHTGRDSGAAIAALPETTNFAQVDRPDAHYFAAGGVLYGVVGYEYPGRDYTPPDKERHYRIGDPDVLPSQAGRGPCTACHMPQENSHRLQALTVDEDGTITEIATPLCAECHKAVPGLGDFTQTPEKLDGLQKDFAAALDALQAQLAAAGFFWYPAFPYFFNDLDGNGTIDNRKDAAGLSLPGDEATFANRERNWGNRGNLGAAFNFNMLHHEPGAWVHNRHYAKRLVHDSIDWLDGGAENSVPGTLGLLANDTPYKAGAIRYLSELNRQ